MGFSGDRELGIDELKAAAELKGTGRSVFAIMMLLMNFLYTETMIGWGNKNWSMINYLLERLTQCCPKVSLRLMETENDISCKIDQLNCDSLEL